MANIQIDITDNGTTTLVTAGKYCDRNIDVNVSTQPLNFTNILKRPSTVVKLNKGAYAGSEATANGRVIIELDLVELGFTTHPANWSLRWRGMYADGTYTGIFWSTDKSSWTLSNFTYNATIDGYGDSILSDRTNYPTTNRYLKMTFQIKGNNQAITQEDLDKCILTINEPIGNDVGGDAPSGVIDITANGTHDVADYASANVNVPNPSTGSLSITENGTYDVKTKASVIVNVPSSGGSEPTQFTNVLTHPNTTIDINKGTADGKTLVTANGCVVITFNLADFGFATNGKKPWLHWRGLSFDTGYPKFFISADEATWSHHDNTPNAVLDECGDFKLHYTSAYASQYKYCRINFRIKNASITTENLAGRILTIEELIGNGGYVV